MRKFFLAAALALAPSLAPAQVSGGPQTFAGCDVFACVSITVGYTQGTFFGTQLYQLVGSGTFTVRPPLATGAYSAAPSPRFVGALFNTPDYDDSRFVDRISLVGRAAGDVVPLRLLGYGRTEPFLSISGFTGLLVGPTGSVTGDRVNIALVPTETVPEPTTLALAAVGIAVGGVAARRRRAA